MIAKLKIGARYLATNNVTLRVGDCRRLLREIASSAAQLVVTSPPYNIGKPYEHRQTLKAYTDDQEQVIAECARILRDGGSLCWQVGNHISSDGQVLPLDIHLHAVFAGQGLQLRNRIIWYYEHGLHCRRRFSGRHETILWYTKGKRYLFDLDAVRVRQKYPGKRAYSGPNKGAYSGHPGGKNPGDVWAIPNVKANHPEKTAHPCQFPIEIPERLILALSKAGDLVVDPFAGAGTTLVAAVLHGRRAAGAEIVKEYASIARRRLRQAQRGTLKRRALGAPIYVPSADSSLARRPTEWCSGQSID